MGAREDIQAQLPTFGLPAASVDSLLAAVSAAGYELQPAGGGAAQPGQTPCEGLFRYPVPGHAGMTLNQLHWKTGAYFYWVSFPGPGGQSVSVPLGQALDADALAGGGASTP